MTRPTAHAYPICLVALAVGFVVPLHDAVAVSVPGSAPCILGCFQQEPGNPSQASAAVATEGGQVKKEEEEEEVPQEEEEGGALLTAEEEHELAASRAELLRAHYETLFSEADGALTNPPGVSRTLPLGIDGDTQEPLYGTFLHPMAPEGEGNSSPINTQVQELKDAVSTLLEKGWSPAPLIGSSFHIDFCVRDRQIHSVGAPPMRVISWRKLAELQSIPRSHLGHAVSIPQAMAEVADSHAAAGPPLMRQYEDNPFGGAAVPEEFYPHLDSELGTVPRLNLVMVSHRWTRPHRDPALAHPDDEAGTKCKLLVEYGKREFASEAKRETYFWIDFTSVDQDDPWRGIQALPLYISNCAGGMVVVASNEYEDRAWCRLEQVGSMTRWCGWGFVAGQRAMRVELHVPGRLIDINWGLSVHI